MPQARYDRYGLTGNPFRELSSDTQENPELYHVNLEVDQSLRSFKEEALDRENRAVIALVGSNGTGKTERLRLAQAEAKERNAVAVYVSIGVKPQGVLPGLAKELLATYKPKGLFGSLSPPKWYRDLSALSRVKGGDAVPSGAGTAIGEALNAQAPAFLLINDLHNLAGSAELTPFLTALQEIADALKPGVLVMFGSYPRFLAETLKSRPALQSRINRTIALPGMARDEAGLMLAKKLLAKRLVEQLDPLYPFDDGAVDAIVQKASGNPRAILKAADTAMEYAVERRSYRVDADSANKALASVPDPSSRTPLPPPVTVRPASAPASAAIPRPVTGVTLLPKPKGAGSPPGPPSRTP